MPAEQAATVDLSALDFTRTIVTIAKIEAANPHRHEMKLLSGVAHIDTEARSIVGYVDTSISDFWVRGHFPKYPVMPGVLMCEAAAQLANYYTAHVHPEYGSAYRPRRHRGSPLPRNDPPRRATHPGRSWLASRVESDEVCRAWPRSSQWRICQCLRSHDHRRFAR